MFVAEIAILETRSQLLNQKTGDRIIASYLPRILRHPLDKGKSYKGKNHHFGGI
jgi:hypothetical protein